uniref:Replication protein A OB domain-containing protein n=1 Tax=Daphnia galeata TaxID=27404 RepID=A0A8J2RB33_9CRUS|nr:unnamed protein product [Daphnia galeata]
MDVITYPIECITPYHSNWTMKVRITQKSDIKLWKNERSEGKLFSMDCIDESGEIRAVAFNEECEKFYPLIKVDEVYYISRAQLKVANKCFSKLKNDYEMNFNRSTTVIPCDDDLRIPGVKFNFIPLEKVDEMGKEKLFDVIGRMKFAADLSVYICQLTKKETSYRDILLQGSDENVKKLTLFLINTHLFIKQVNVTLWGKLGEEIDVSSTPVIALKGVKLINPKNLFPL